MSRMADPLVCQWKSIYSALLLIIALCVIAHFLMEDISLQRTLDPASQVCFNVGLTFDEMEHQDDLAMASALPESILHNDPAAIPARSIPLERQSAFAIRIPPRIA